MAASREQILLAWEKWDTAQPMTAEEQALLTTDATGGRRIPDDPGAAQLKAFLAEHGHKPVTHKALSDLMQGQAEIFADVTRPLRRRIDALEAEVRAGHARILALEAEQKDHKDGD
ncbi:hypothetical protein Q4543_24380 [Salipiger sp. 1_MG-2023]|uniref:hypothetical protein n=1 Tax=Salipiger sp. 1_MG-2023 TaxID=3062665 RepID=UPI0026E1E27A|nr:hypothetical protein [Salipiger sp. 1_MG-2023]MDO6588581.1 hypothetical protein [Salipiger sp. 1_MG-2023]